MADYLSTIAAIPHERIAYVDEAGIDNYLYREYGRAKRGKRVFGKVRGRRFKRTGIVAAKRGESVICPLQYEGTMDSALFEQWFEQCLLNL